MIGFPTWRQPFPTSPATNALQRATRWLLGTGSRTRAADAQVDYAAWLEQRIQRRRSESRIQAQPGIFSILTCAYQRSPAELLREIAQSVLTQTYSEFEWVLLAQGQLNEHLDRVLAEIASDPRVKLLRLPENLGIIRSLHACLAAATGRYALPVDADDLLTVDALEIMARAIAEHHQPAFLYSDEDVLAEGQFRSPYLRPAWDPVLNSASSYIWHLCAFDCALARQLGVYTDLAGEWCQDWHSVFRFVDAGYQPVHVPEVLYHWRAHSSSSTNQEAPHEGSLKSQYHLLSRQIARQADPSLYAIKPFPMFRGAPEWWIERQHVRPEPMAFVFSIASAEPAEVTFETLREIIQNSRFPFNTVHLITDRPLDSELKGELSNLLHQLQTEYGLSCPTPSPVCCHDSLTPEVFRQLGEPFVALCESGVRPTGQQWPWEALGLFGLHRDVLMIAGRIVNPDGIVCGGGEIFGYGGVSNCLEHARLPHEPGPWALLLKQRTVDAVNPAFFLARTSFLRRSEAAWQSAASRRSLGIWLGAAITQQGLRVAATPLVSAQARASLDVQSSISDREASQLRQQFNDPLGTGPWYPRHLSRKIPHAYEFAGS